MTAYFVTSTGTGIGKTFTTCALLHAARKARGYKPVISGWDDSAETDTAQIIAASGNVQTVAEVSPHRFAAPLSPHRAAALEGRALTLAEVVATAQTQLATTASDTLTLIEGVGGVMVPLNDEHTVLDWMQAMALPVILVTGSYLGTISHTLTALAVLRAAGLKVSALVINESENSSVDFIEAQAGILPFIRDIPLQVFQPRVSSWREASAIAGLVSRI